MSMVTKCMFGHTFYNWIEDESYRHCINCDLWEHLEVCNNINKWVACASPLIYNTEKG